MIKMAKSYAYYLEKYASKHVPYDDEARKFATNPKIESAWQEFLQSQENAKDLSRKEFLDLSVMFSFYLYDKGQKK